MSKNTIIFDMDGIIFDTERLYFESYKLAYEKHGIRFTEEDYSHYVGRTSDGDFQDVIKRTGGNKELAKTIYDDAKNIKAEFDKNRLETMPGLFEILDFLKNNNFNIHLASTTEKKLILQYLEQAGISDYFTIVIGGDEVKQSKPDPEIYMKVLELANIDASEAFVIEDSKAGVLSAHQANIDVIMVPDFAKPDESITNLPYEIVNSLNDVIRILERILNTK